MPFEIFEAVNHRNALLHLLTNVKPGFRITEEYLLRPHAIVMYNFHDKLPGRYRTGHVNLTNTEKKLPSAREVPVRMRGVPEDGESMYRWTGESVLRGFNLLQTGEL